MKKIAIVYNNMENRSAMTHIEQEIEKVFAAFLKNEKNRAGGSLKVQYGGVQTLDIFVRLCYYYGI